MRPADSSTRAAQRVVVAHQPRVRRPERDHDPTGKGRDVDEPLRALAPGVGDAVGEHEAALGVGVVDLDGRAVERADDVAGLDRGAAREVLGRPDHPEHAHGCLAARPARRSPRSRPRRRTCRTSSRACVPAGLSEIPPESNVTALPTSASSGASPSDSPAPLYSSRISQACSREPCATAANAPIPASRIAVSPSTRRLDAEPPGELLGVIGERRRRQVVGGRVAEVAGPVLGGRHDRRGPDRLGDVVVGAQRERLNLTLARVVRRRVRLVAVEPVRVQQRALDEPLDDVVADMVGDLPAHLRRAQLARPAGAPPPRRRAPARRRTSRGRRGRSGSRGRRRRA